MIGNHRMATVIAATLLAVCSPAASAVTLVDKPVDDTYFGWSSTINDVNQQMADELTLASSAVANQLTWYGLNYMPTSPTNTFRIHLYADAGGVPAITPFYNQLLGIVDGTPTGLTNDANIEILQYHSPIPAVPLNAGTYWLSIATTEFGWIWSHATAAAVGDNEYYRTADFHEWLSVLVTNPGSVRLDQAFTLSGVVPEPASLFLAGPAIAAAALAHHRRRA